MDNSHTATVTPEHGRRLTDIRIGVTQGPHEHALVQRITVLDRVESNTILEENIVRATIQRLYGNRLFLTEKLEKCIYEEIRFP